MNISINDTPYITEYGLEKGYQMIRDAGFEAIDLSSLATVWDYPAIKRTGTFDGSSVILSDFETVKAHFQPQLDAIKKAGLSIDLAHAPLTVNFKAKPELEKLYVRGFENCIRLCDYANVPYLVIHPVSCLYDDLSAPLKDIEELSFNRMAALIPLLKSTNVKVCLENLFIRDTHKRAGGIYSIVCGACCDAVDAAAQIDRLNELAGKECFAFCLDTGHMNLTGRKFSHFISVMGRRIQALHIHDNAGYEDQHSVAFSGTVNWDEFIEGLRDIGYNGTINFELSGEPMLASVYNDGKTIEKMLTK